MDIKKEKVLEKSKEKSSREILIQNILELSINSGKVSQNTKYILYAEETKEDRRKKVKKIEENLIKIITNVVNISNSLEIKTEDIIKEVIKKNRR